MSTKKHTIDAARSATKSATAAVFHLPPTGVAALIAAVVPSTCTVANATASMTPARLATGIAPMAGAANTTHPPMLAAYPMALSAPLPPDCALRSVCGMSPHPPNPPSAADATLPAASPASRRLLDPREARPSLLACSATTLDARSVSSTEIIAILTATGKMTRSVAAVHGTAVSAPTPAHVGSTASPPANVAALPCARVATGSCRAAESAVARTTAAREEGIAVVTLGRSLTTRPVKSATARVAACAAPVRPRRTASCDLMRRHPRPLRKPFMTLSVTRSTSRPSLSAPNAAIMSAAKTTVGAMYTWPWLAMSGASGTTTTPAAPAISPGRPPTPVDTAPRTTDDQMPMSGLTPAMLANAMEVGTEASATTNPERSSFVTAGEAPRSTSDGE
mmetsp:Transcript_22599/g.53695  ORF Transcript_22599/g.53695 Transcript_22599/m.53695 type:complete len:393 (+) Transcript_22599:208-1386(+)